MSGIYRVDNVPVTLASADDGELDVDVVSNKNLIVIGSSKTAGHAIVDTGVAATSTRIMHGTEVAKLIKEDGVTEVELWGDSINRFALFVAGDKIGRLINLNAYGISDYPQDDTKLMLKFDKSNVNYPTYDDAAVYKWDDELKVFAFEREAYEGVNMWVLTIGPPKLLDGVLVYLEGRSFDVDEDGPHMQVGIPTAGGTKAYTQYSIYRETTTTSYSASMIESADCKAIAIQLNDGTSTPEKYAQMSDSQGLELLAQMRSVRYRSYAPDGVCADATQNAYAYAINEAGEAIVDEDGDLIITPIPINGKESNYSLSNLIKRYDFWTDYIDKFGGEIPLTFPCGIDEAITQQGYVTGYVSTPSADPKAWSGMRTMSVPRIKSYTPRFTHVEYKASEHTLSWQEVTVRSYILFNNFNPEGTQKGVQPFGAGGVAWFGSSYDPDDTVS